MNFFIAVLRMPASMKLRSVHRLFGAAKRTIHREDFHSRNDTPQIKLTPLMHQHNQLRTSPRSGGWGSTDTRASETLRAQRKASRASDWMLLFLFYSVTIVASLSPTTAADVLLIVLLFIIAVTSASTSFQFLRCTHFVASR